jgi:RimJ/RimL family protein N-acetyltransferase
MPFPDTRTERLLLRDLEPRDASRIFEYRSHPEVARFQTWGTDSLDEIQSYIAKMSGIEPATPGLWYQVGIVMASGRELIGDCGFHVPNMEPRQAEIGIALAPEYQSKGYAAEALHALLDYLLVRLDNHRVFASVDPRNVSSVALMRRLGLRNEAHSIRSLWFKGEWVDDMIFAVLASDWKSKVEKSS